MAKKYFIDKNNEVRKLIEKCTEDFVDDSIKLDYIMNVLTQKHMDGKTVKEIFIDEANAKEDFEINLYIQKNHV
jgi:hypothetical protein